MIRAFCKAAAFAVALAVSTGLTAQGAIQTDPTVLYQQMKAAYDRAQANGWDYFDQKVYLGTILDAGRAYSLQMPNDPAYAELATLTVQIGEKLHYNPLTDHDAAAWYVREAAQYVAKNATDATLVQSADDLLARANAEDDPQTLARLADADAQANLVTFPRNVEAELEAVEADWRAWLLTGDATWKALAFKRAADPNFPLAHTPTTWGPEFLRAIQSSDDPNARIVVDRLGHLTSPLVIASVRSVPHDAYLTTLAPADEYFGRMGYSVIGIENELKKINTYLDYHYGDRESGEAVLVADAIDAMHKVYPRDIDLPKLLYACLQTLHRMDTDATKSAAAHVQSILVVEYQDSPEARKVLGAN